MHKYILPALFLLTTAIPLASCTKKTPPPPQITNVLWAAPTMIPKQEQHNGEDYIIISTFTEHIIYGESDRPNIKYEDTESIDAFVIRQTADATELYRDSKSDTPIKSFPRGTEYNAISEEALTIFESEVKKGKWQGKIPHNYERRVGILPL